MRPSKWSYWPARPRGRAGRVVVALLESRITGIGLRRAGGRSCARASRSGARARAGSRGRRPRARRRRSARGSGRACASSRLCSRPGRAGRGSGTPRVSASSCRLRKAVSSSIASRDAVLAHERVAPAPRAPAASAGCERQQRPAGLLGGRPSRRSPSRTRAAPGAARGLCGRDARGALGERRGGVEAPRASARRRRPRAARASSRSRAAAG